MSGAVRENLYAGTKALAAQVDVWAVVASDMDGAGEVALAVVAEKEEATRSVGTAAMAGSLLRGGLGPGGGGGGGRPGQRGQRRRRLVVVVRLAAGLAWRRDESRAARRRVNRSAPAIGAPIWRVPDSPVRCGAETAGRLAFGGSLLRSEDDLVGFLQFYRRFPP